MTTNLNYATQIAKLVKLLKEAGIPHEVGFIWDGFQVCYPTDAERRSDVVCHQGSYGHQDGLLEMMGLVNEEDVSDSVEGYLTADEVYARWAEDWAIFQDFYRG